MSYILAGDIGGTKTLLQISTVAGTTPVLQKSFCSTTYANLADMLDEFLREAGVNKISAACFALAGTVNGRLATLTNLPWRVDADAIAARFDIARVSLINDFEGVGLGLSALQEHDLLTLQAGHAPSSALQSGALPSSSLQSSPSQSSHAQAGGVRLVVGAGTGLGVGWLTCCPAGPDNAYTAHPSEGGHMDFAPRDATQYALLHYLQQRHGHVSYERIVSGGGLVTLLEFLRDSGRAVPSMQLLKQMAEGDPAAAIARAAQHENEPIARMALDLFISIYGAFVGNLALLMLPRGGIYVAGGIAAKIAADMQQGAFLHALRDKGRFANLLEMFPVHLVTHPNVGLFGARLAACRT